MLNHQFLSSSWQNKKKKTKSLLISEKWQMRMYWIVNRNTWLYLMGHHMGFFSFHLPMFILHFILNNKEKENDRSIIYTAMQYKWTIFKKDFKNPIFQVQFRLCTYMFAIHKQIKALNRRLLISIPCCSNTSLKWSSTSSSKTLKITSPLFFYSNIGNIYLYTEGHFIYSIPIGCDEKKE